MSTAQLNRQDFARLLQDRLIGAGEDRPLEYDGQAFSLIRRGAERQSAVPLEPFHRMYLAAPQDLEFVVKQFVEYWKGAQRTAPAGHAGPTVAPPPFAPNPFGGPPALAPPPPAYGTTTIRAQPRRSGASAVWIILGVLALMFCGVIVLPMVLMFAVLGVAIQNMPRPGAPGAMAPLNFPDFPQHGIPPGADTTETLGGPGGGPQDFYDRQGRPAIGMAYLIDEHWDQRPSLKALQPVFDRGAAVRDWRGQSLTVVAGKDGYVVGGLLVDAEKYVNAVKIVFVRQQDGQIDLTDTYESDWLGTPTGKEPQKLAAAGETVLGVHARQGIVIDSVGLIIRRPGMPNEPPPGVLLPGFPPLPPPPGAPPANDQPAKNPFE